MVSVLISGSSGLGLSSGRGHCVVVLDKTLCSHSVSPPRVHMGTSNAGGNPMMDQHPIQGRVEIFLVMLQNPG